MDITKIVEIVLVVFLALLLGTAISYKRIQALWLLLRTPRSYTNALPNEGIIKVSGKAGPSVSQSPFTKTVCAFWHIKVEEYKRYGRSGRWVDICNQVSSQPFKIQDELGSIFVQPSEKAVHNLKANYKARSGMFNKLDGETLAIVESLGVTTKGMIFDKTLRVIEYCLPADAPVVIFGEIHANNGSRSIGEGKKIPFILSQGRESDLVKFLVIRMVPIFIILLLLGALVMMGLLF
jgi:hypothetical protein